MTNPLSMTVSYYDVLNVPSTASLTTIKEAYRKLVKQYHPDKQTISREPVQSSEASAMNIDVPLPSSDIEDNPFLHIQTAWECLRDSIQRRWYDESLYQQRKLRIQQQEISRQNLKNAIPIHIHECRSYTCSRSTDGPPDPDSGPIVEDEILDWIYQCRCGYDLYVAQSYPTVICDSRLPTGEEQPLQLMPYDTTPLACNDYSDSMMIQCVGCSIFYNISPLFIGDEEVPVTKAEEQGISNHKFLNTKKAKT